MNNSVWIFIAASEMAEKRFRKYTSAHPDLYSVNPFELHLVFLDTAISNWQRYIADRMERVQKQSNRVMLAPTGTEKQALLLDFEINFSDRQMLKQMEDQVLDIVVILDSTTDTVSSLLEKYKICVPQDDQTSYSRVAYDPIEIGFREKLQELSLIKTKTEALMRRIQGTTSLVSSLLEYESAQITSENAQITAANGRSLEQLAQEARIENITMRMLTEKSTRDASSVQVLTIMTLVYLPSTVVASFFSTGFVRHDDTGKLVVAKNAWVYAATAAPLTIMTLLVWRLWSHYRTRRIALETQNLHAATSSENEKENTSIDIEQNAKGRATLRTRIASYRMTKVPQP
ncbi:MAG: hypothetical protein M1814_002778 [Vezdaea aestivalis]|nr:MAG: hypothetical protein M1814_002778 [Vezdaea aestivalis]